MFLDDILSGVVFQLVGATVRLGVYRIVSLFTGNNPPSFVDIFDGTNEDDSHVLSGKALLNGINGFIGFGHFF